MKNTYLISELHERHSILLNGGVAKTASIIPFEDKK